MGKTLIALMAVLALAGAACSKSSSSTPAANPTSASTSSCTADNATALSGDLTIQNFAFHPDCFSVSAGSTISVSNKDTTTHTFTVEGTDVNVSVDPTTTQDATAPDAGTYSFHCNIHPTMTGTLVVT